MNALSAAAHDEDGDIIKALQARVADLEAQLYAVGAGGVGKMEPPQSVTDCHQSQPRGEQPAMTPIAQRKLDDLLTRGYEISGYSVYHGSKHQHGFVTTAGLVGWWKPEGAEYPQPQGEQEPVAWIENIGGGVSYNPYHEAARKLPDGVRFDLYTRPQPPRQPLTDEAERQCPYPKSNPSTRDAWLDGWEAAEREHGIGGEAKTRMCPSTYYECSRGCGDGGCKDFSDAHGIGESRHD